MRAFIAVDIEDPRLISSLSSIKNTISTLNVPIKFVEDENLHITLVFLGEIDESTVETLKSGLEENIKHPPFEISVEGLGSFPSLSRPRVVWAGIRKGSKELTNIHETVMKTLNTLNIRVKGEKFHPHVTIGRLKGSRNIQSLTKLLIEYSNYFFGEQQIDKVKIKQSILTPKGPIYRDVYVKKLV